MRAMSRAEYWGILGAGLVVFLAFDKVFDNPFAIDGSIIWSYLVVFLLVPIVLIIRRQLTFKNFFFYELELILLKYAITTCIAVALWATNDPPARPPPVASAPAEPKHHEPPAPSVIDSANTATVEGRVSHEDGTPAAGVLVYVDSGLEDLVFAAPQERVSIENDGSGFSPPMTVLRTYQELRLTVGDGQLHTLAGENERGEQVLSVPMVASGRAVPFSTRRDLGPVRLYCRVHEDEPKSAHLVVLTHPFHTRTGPDGRFAIPGVPARLVTVRAFSPPVSGRTALRVKPGTGQQLDITLGPEEIP